jgi:hypothetical protein
MVVFAIGIEHALDVTVQRPHNANAGEHRRAVQRRNEHQRLHCCLPFGLAEIAKRESQAAEHDAVECIGLLKETDMPQNRPDPVSAEAGEQVPARPHDTGSAANETVDGLDAATEELRHAAEDTPSGTGPGDIEKTPVFDRADLAPKI